MLTWTATWTAWWPWLTIAGLGLFHGLNPAMGWLFAVALVVYDRVGVAFLRTGWVNLDWIWTAALGLCGVVLLVM